MLVQFSMADGIARWLVLPFLLFFFDRFGQLSRSLDDLFADLDRGQKSAAFHFVRGFFFGKRENRNVSFCSLSKVLDRFREKLAFHPILLERDLVAPRDIIDVVSGLLE